MDLNLVLELTWADLPDSLILRHERAVAMCLEDAEIDSTVVILDIEADYTPYCPGRYDGHPDNMYPAEEADVEILGHVISFLISDKAWAMPIPNEEKLMADILQYARDWLECEIDQIREQLIDKGKYQHGDEMSYIMAQVEEEMERKRERIEDDFRDGAGIEDKVRGAVADWVSRRTNSPEEN